MKRGFRLGALLSAVLLVAVVFWLIFPGPFARGVIVGVVMGLGGLAGGLVFVVRRLRGRMEGSLTPPPLPTGAWDYAVDLEDPAGNRIPAAQFKGNVLIINFWATWCAPCVAEMPGLTRLHEAASDLGVNMVCVTQEPWDEVSAFVEKRGVTAPIYRLLDDPPEQFRSRSIPATFILDRAGMVALRHFGAARWDDDRVVTFVRGLAATPHGEHRPVTTKAACATGR